MPLPAWMTLVARPDGVTSASVGGVATSFGAGIDPCSLLEAAITEVIITKDTTTITLLNSIISFIVSVCYH